MSIFLSIDRLSDGLLNYWSFTNNVMDTIGTAHLINGVNATLGFDRFNRSNSALDLSFGYYQAPNGTYFNGPFTIAAWYCPKTLKNLTRILDFGISSTCSPYVAFAINDQKAYVRISNNDTNYWSTSSNLTLNVLNWTHLAATFDGNSLKFYQNGIQTSKPAKAGIPLDVIRISNYIGKNCQKYQENLNGILDEVRIYNRSLNLFELF